MEKLEKGAVYSGQVDGYSSDGLGIVRINGAVVFVPGAVRGETVDLRITRVMRSSAAGELMRVHTPSPDRIEPDCPWFGQCGGCDFRHISYAEELRAKRQRVQDALARLGGSAVQVEAIQEAENPFCYRNKCQYPVGSHGEIGFYRAGSHDVTSVERCLLQPEVCDRTAKAVGAWMQRYQVPAYDEKTGRGLIRHIYVRVNRRGESLCCITANGKKAPREPELAAMVLAAAPKTVGVVWNTNTRKGNGILGDKYRTIWGDNFLMDTLCGFTFKLSVPSFYQVNPVQAEALYSKVLEFAALGNEETAVDLYCGVGTITLCLAREAGHVTGAEIVPEAIRDAEENAVRNGIKNVEFFCGDVSEVAAKLAAEGRRPNVITVDPPRKGLTPEVIASIAEMFPKRIVYVSCDPATLGRDVKLFERKGYPVTRAMAVDMFPRTKHVETIILLQRENS